MQTNFLQNVSWRLHPEISKAFPENGRNPKYERQPFGLIKRWKAGLKDLLISTWPRRRIEERAMRDYRKRIGSKPTVSIQHCTYKSTCWSCSKNQRLLIETFNCQARTEHGLPKERERNWHDFLSPYGAKYSIWQSPTMSLKRHVQQISGMLVDISSVRDYFNLEVIWEEQSHGTEKSRETKENKDQPETTGTL